MLTYEGKKSILELSGCDPLTPFDIAETIVFCATRRENVVIADTLIFPNHQVWLFFLLFLFFLSRIGCLVVRC